MTEVTAEQLETLTLGIAASECEFLSPIGPLIIASAALGIADNSRSFSRTFDIEHAIVIRECNALEHESSLIHTETRRQKSQRIYYQLTDKAADMVSAIKIPNESAAS